MMIFFTSSGVRLISLYRNILLEASDTKSSSSSSKMLCLGSIFNRDKKSITSCWSFPSKLDISFCVSVIRVEVWSPMLPFYSISAMIDSTSSSKFIFVLISIDWQLSPKFSICSRSFPAKLLGNSCFGFFFGRFFKPNTSSMVYR